MRASLLAGGLARGAVRTTAPGNLPVLRRDGRAARSAARGRWTRKHRGIGQRSRARAGQAPESDLLLIGGRIDVAMSTVVQHLNDRVRFTAALGASTRPRLTHTPRRAAGAIASAAFPRYARRGGAESRR